MTGLRSDRLGGARAAREGSARSPLAIDVTVARRRAVLTMAGELDITTAAFFLDAVEEAGATTPWVACLDMGNVTFIDLHGVRALGASRSSLRSQSCIFEISAPSAPVRRLLEWTGLGGLLVPGAGGLMDSTTGDVAC